MELWGQNEPHIMTDRHSMLHLTQELLVSELRFELKFHHQVEYLVQEVEEVEVPLVMVRVEEEQMERVRLVSETVIKV